MLQAQQLFLIARKYYKTCNTILGTFLQYPLRLTPQDGGIAQHMEFQ